MRWLTLLLIPFLLAGCGGDDDVVSSDIECTSAFLNDTRLDMAEVSLAGLRYLHR